MYFFASRYRKMGDFMFFKRFLWGTVFAGELVMLCATGSGAPVVNLAENGKAKFPVVVSEKATERTRKDAQTLARYLGLISGANFEVVEGSGKTGIAVGTASDFPTLASFEENDDPLVREEYVIQSHPNGIYLIGRSEVAAEHAVWDFLYQLGYRQFFPGKNWEVIPSIRKLTYEGNIRTSPDYHTRRIWYGYGTWDYNAQPYDDWCAKNRINSDFVLNTGHAYQTIVLRNKKVFEEHPEYLGLVNGKRTSDKLCISNPGLRKLVVEWALKSVEESPDSDSISMEPSDGAGWCECDSCLATGTPSDRAVMLANTVAQALRERFGTRYRVGMYAYNMHSPPPHRSVDPGVIVSIATSFIKGGYTVDQLIDGWSKQGARLGIREYYGVNVWDRDLPGRSRGSNTTYITRTIPEFYRKGARFMSAESSDNWGPNGPGYYLASRFLWSVDEAQKLQFYMEDFLEKSFGRAKEPMREFYRLIDGGNSPLLSADLVGRMYLKLREAKKCAKDAAVSARINDLILYTRYVELFRAYEKAKGQARQEAFENLIRFAYRIRTTMMVHTKALYRDLPSRDKSVNVPADAGWNVPEGKNPWKTSEPFSEAEIEGILTGGIERNKIVEYQSTGYSSKLVPSHLPPAPRGSIAMLRGTYIFYLWPEDGKLPELIISAGHIYTNLGSAHWKLTDASGKVLEEGEVPPDKAAHKLVFRTAGSNPCVFEYSDRSMGSSISWLQGNRVCLRADRENRFFSSGRSTLYFFVPKGQKQVVLYGEISDCVFLDPAGNQVLKYAGGNDYIVLAVNPGQDGKAWCVRNVSGSLSLMNIPPFLAVNPYELLIPEEVSIKDF